MSYQPDFTRLQKALNGLQPDRVPLFELAIAKSVKESYLGRKITAYADEIDFAIQAGYDYIKVSPMINLNPGQVIPKEGARVSQATSQSAERQWHSTGQGIITSLEEYEKFRWPAANEVDYSPFENIKAHLPDGMKIVAQYGDIFTWVWDFMGFETFSFALVENEELVRRMFDTIGSIELNLFENMASFDQVGAIFYSDDIAINTGLFVSPNVYRTYLFPYMKKISDICKKYHLPFIYHSDGNLWQVLNDLKACGVDALHPIEPQAMDIRELKQIYGRQFCLIGNVDVDLLSRGEAEQVRQVVKDLLRDIAPGGGYCLGSGNSVPEYVNLENFKAMLETAHVFGQYTDK